MNNEFKTRQRQHSGRLLVGYGDKIAGILRMAEADIGIVDVDRECFDKDEGQNVTDVIKWLRQAATECYSLGGTMAGQYVGEQLAGLAEPPPERTSPDGSEDVW